jgi:hypothetical protein
VFVPWIVGVIGGALKKVGRWLKETLLKTWFDEYEDEMGVN